MQRKAAFVCCSDSRHENERSRIMLAAKQLEAAGIQTVIGKHIFTDDHYFFAVDARTIAKELMYFYSNPQITDIFDISGGDIANGILPYLDYDIIAKSNALFWGYSDLTTIINAIYARTGKSSVLYQVKNLVWSEEKLQRNRFKAYLAGDESKLFHLDYRFLQGTKMEGVVIGGNIRCFTKLAGTPYLPDSRGKILLFESYGGGSGQIATVFSQLEQIGVFDQAAGVLLGTFTQYEKANLELSVFDLLKMHISDTHPVAHTSEIGHGHDAKAIIIGKNWKGSSYE